MIAEIDAGVAEARPEALRAKGSGVSVHVHDVTKEQEVKDLARRVVEAEGCVHILLANAGIALLGVAAEDERWLQVYDVNYNGFFRYNRAFGRHMLQVGGGAIVNIGSMSGYISNQPQKQTYYNASKAAGHQMISSLAAGWADRGVRVNAVAPTLTSRPR